MRISRVNGQLCVWIVAEDIYGKSNIELHLYYDKEINDIGPDVIIIVIVVQQEYFVAKA